MVSCHRLLLVAAAVPLSAAKMLRVHDGAVKGGQRFTSLLENDEDVSVYATVNVGDQKVKCVMDTGSSEQVVFSSKCDNCGGHMYDCDKDPNCKWGEHQTVQSYGSGDAYCTEARTSLAVTSSDGNASSKADEQMVWLVTSSELDIELDGTMQCIFGLGPAGSAVAFAKEEYQALKTFLGTMPADDREEWSSELKELQQHVGFMKGVTLFQESAKVASMSFCLHPEFGRDGDLIVNDDFPERYPHAFVEAPAAGLYWELDMTEAHISFEKATASSCTGKAACGAIMDTGTSLIGAPAHFVSEISTVLADLLPKHGCETGDLHMYPDFSLKLGGHSFTLPPHSYICKFDADEVGEVGGSSDYGDIGDSDDYFPEEDDEDDNGPIIPYLRGQRLRGIAKRMRHIRAFKDAHERRFGGHPGSNSSDGKICAPCLFELDQEDDSEQWLFGLPFFREYYTTFRTTENYREANKMLFAKADDKCIPQAQGKAGQLRKTTGVQHVKLHKLRLPTTLSHHSGWRTAGRARKVLTATN